jgi:hypothetical protein
MATPSETGKICIVCGADCSNKPRTKDAKGRYYCKECHERARERKHAQPAPTAAPHNGGEIELEGAPSALSMLDQLADAAPPLVPDAHCPSCGFAMPSAAGAGAAVCTHCGFNVQAGRVIKPKVLKAPRIRQAGGAIWPIIVGAVSIIFGAAGTLLYGGSMLLNVVAASQQGARPMLFAFGLGGLVTAMSLWLLRDGVRIIQRNPSVVSSIRIWAFVKALIFGTCFGLALAVPNKALGEALATQSAGRASIDVATFKSVLVLIMLWYLFWPAFIIAWFFIPRIQDDVEAW